MPRTPHPTRRFVAALVAGDAASIAVAAVAAYFVRFGDVIGNAAPGRLHYAAVEAAMVPLWILAIAGKGGYDPAWVGAGPEEFRRVTDGALVYLALVATAAFAGKYDLARGFVVVAVPLAALLTLAFRYAARRWLHRQRSLGRHVLNVVVVGSEVGVRRVVDCLESSRHAGFVVAACCSPGGSGVVRTSERTLPVAPLPEDLVAFARGAGAGAIVVARGSPFADGSLRDLAWRLERTGIRLLVAPDFADMPEPRVAFHRVADLPLLRLEEPELRGVRRVLKGSIDRVGAGLALVLLFPVFAVLGLAVRLSSGRPVLFRQVRVGREGRTFTMWKFRTMVVDAEALRPGLAARNEQDGLLFKIRDDPRVTPLGRVLRRWSLDELPQLWNVLRGDMSLVGPRPPLPCEVARYSDVVRRRLRVKPGLTGLWQVSGRSHLSWEESVRLDLHYVQNWSPSLDTMILARTVLAIVRKRGAY